jgi:hypothetical protein
MSSLFKHEFRNICILLPYFSSNERRVDDDHIEGMVEVLLYILYFVEIEEHKVLVFLAEGLIKLNNKLMSGKGITYIEIFTTRFDFFVLHRKVDTRNR